MVNEYSWALDSISHSAHYSANWDKNKQSDYNKWYYQNVTKKDAAKSTLNEEDVNEHYGPEDQDIKSIHDQVKDKPIIDQGDSASSIYDEEEKEPEKKKVNTPSSKDVSDGSKTVNEILSKHGLESIIAGAIVNKIVKKK